VAALPDDIDQIFHLAALNGRQKLYERPLDVIRVCTLQTMLLVDRYRRQALTLKRVVYAGTSEAYASTITRFNWPVPTAEDMPLGIDDVTNPR
jgi:nucleoside-diphosphate-sugar epimerase